MRRASEEADLRAFITFAINYGLTGEDLLELGSLWGFTENMIIASFFFSAAV